MGRRTKEVGIKRYSTGVLMIIAFVVTLLCAGIGTSRTEEETIQVGEVAMRRYVALRDAVDTVSTERLQTAAASSVGPIYKNDIVVEENSTKQVNEVFQELNDILLRLGEGEDFYTRVQNASLNLPVVLTARQLAAYQEMSRANRILFAEDCVAVLNQIYSEGLSADELDAGKTAVQEGIASTAWNTDLKAMAYTIVSAALDPNLVLDEDAMEAEREKKRSEVSDVMVRKNQKIVDEGEIITQDIYDRLIALGLAGDGQAGSVFAVLGAFLMVTLIFGVVLLFFLWNRGISVLKDNEARMLFCIYVIMVLVVRATTMLTYYSLIPLGLFAMQVSLLIGRRMALLLNCFFSIIACLIFRGDVEFLVYALVSGSFGAVIIQKTAKRSHMVPAAVGMAAASFAAVFAAGLFFQEGYSTALLTAAGLGALLGLISVVIAVGSLPLWESVFEANTPLKLLELTNPNNELLRRLMIEAPGTYHHSLIVANLAETAVYEIGGNTALARAGAYYHDIGKLRNPLFFSENQSGHNPHDDLEPQASARIITQHTKNGAELGLEHGLPKVILNIIKEHHGNSLVKYFYFKALKAYGAENVEEKDYRYNERIPSSREAAVVMLADTVEAAVRAMLGNGKTLPEVEELIRGLIKDKLDDGQLDKSGLAIHELEIIRKAFIKVFQGMYHERVSYPKKEEIEAASRKNQPVATAKEDVAQDVEKGETSSDHMDRQPQ